MLHHKASDTDTPSPHDAPEYLIPRSGPHLQRSSALVRTVTGGWGSTAGLVRFLVFFFNAVFWLLIRQPRGEKLTWM